MKKFVVIYRVPVDVMQDWRTNTPPEEMKKQGEKIERDMMEWMKKNENSIVDKGLPLGKNTRMTTGEGIQAVSNDLNAYVVVEADDVEAVAQMFKENPHMQIPKAYLDIMEVPHFG